MVPPVPRGFASWISGGMARWIEKVKSATYSPCSLRQGSAIRSPSSPVSAAASATAAMGGRPSRSVSMPVA